MGYIWIYLKQRKYCNFGAKNSRRAWHVFPAQEVKNHPVHAQAFVFFPFRSLSPFHPGLIKSFPSLRHHIGWLATLFFILLKCSIFLQLSLRFPVSVDAELCLPVRRSFRPTREICLTSNKSARTRIRVNRVIQSCSRRTSCCLFRLDSASVVRRPPMSCRAICTNFWLFVFLWDSLVERTCR